MNKVAGNWTMVGENIHFYLNSSANAFNGTMSLMAWFDEI
jgi:hypothetical protein